MSTIKEHHRIVLYDNDNPNASIIGYYDSYYIPAVGETLYFSITNLDKDIWAVDREVKEMMVVNRKFRFERTYNRSERVVEENTVEFTAG